MFKYRTVFAMFDLIRLLIFVRFVAGFNVDVERAIVYKGTEGSYYGATTEMLSNSEGNWVLVGAPRQNYSSIIKPGAIYRCPISPSSTSSPACSMLNIRADVSAFNTIKAEENQGLGLNMLITNSYLVACSPSWKYAASPDTYYAYGKCSDVPISSMATNYNKLFNVPSGLYVRNNKVFYLAVEFGFSSAFRSGFGNNGIVMGMPVVYDSSGGFIYYRESNVPNFWDRFDVIDQGAADSLSTVFRSGAYLGYSIGAGVFGPSLTESPSSFPMVVMGAPGFSNNDGTVGAMGIFERISLSSMRMRKLVAGKLIGSGFGQSLVVADFNGDNRDDIAVGAPMEGEDSMNNVDVGAVYIYYGTRDSNYIDTGNEQRLRGSGTILARFGLSIACPGDLNKDGFKDLIVGAPYEQDNKGAIYIFNGGSPQVEAMYSQRIFATDIDSNLRGFGFSLSKNTIDVDSNTYTDTSVGSVLSSHTVVFRTRSIVTITSIPILNPIVMPLNSTRLTCRGDSDDFNPCTTVEVCFNYTGDGIANGIYIDYTLTSDPETSDLKERRFTFYLNNVTQGTVYTKTQLFIASGETKCETLHARIAMTDRKFFSRVNDRPQFDVTYKVSNKSAGNEVRPIFNKDKVSEVANVTGEFLTECGATCKPDLTITGRALTSLVQVGKTQELEVQILVLNLADPAYGASVVVNTSIGATFSSYAVLLEQGSERMTCVKEGDGARCTFDKNPLFPQVRGLLNVRFDVSSLQLLRGVALQSLPGRTEVLAVAEVAGDVDVSNNVAQMTTNLQLQSTIQMIGSSSPDQVRISGSGSSKLTLNQAYSIINTGPSPLPGMKAVFSIPVMYRDKSIIGSSQVELSSLSPSITCNMTSFPSPGSVTSSPNVVNPDPSVIINPENTVPLGCGVSGVGCAVYECTIPDLEVDFLQAIIIRANITEQNLPDIPAGTTQIHYYTTGILYPASNLEIPVNLPSNVTYSAVLPIFPNNILARTEELNLWPLIVGLSVGVLLMVLLAIALWKLGFFRRKKREELNQYKRKSYAHQRQSRAALRASRDLDADDRRVLSQYANMN